MPNFPFTVGDSLRIGSATISASGNAVVLPTGTQVGNQNVATTVEVSTGGGPKITNLQVTSNVYVVLDDTAVDLTGGFVKLTGTNFVSGCMVYVASTPANSTTFVSTTEVRAQLPATAAGTYPVYLVNPDGGTAIRVPGVTFSASPAWQTASSLGEQYDGVVLTLPVVATDATVYTLTSGSLPPGLSLNSNTGVISGTVSGVANDTVYSFTITATDAQLQDSPRTFTVTITVSDPYFKLTTLLLSGSAVSANSVVRDSSTNNFNLTVAGDARASNFTPYGTGWSVYFDGTGDYLSFSANTALAAGTGNFTCEFWFYNSHTTWSRSMDFLDAETNGLAIYTNGSGVLAATKQNVAGVAKTLGTLTTTNAPLNQWNHFAIVRSSGSIVCYINGTPLSSSVADSNDYGSFTRIGGTGDGYIIGNLSNFRFVKGTAVYTANFTPATTNLTSVANTSLLTCNANRFLDGSTNNFTITRNGDAAIRSFNPFNITNTGVNGSMYFDGTDDYVTVGTTASSAFAFSGDFTIEAWFYKPGNGSDTYEVLLSVGDGNGVNGFFLEIDDTRSLAPRLYMNTGALVLDGYLSSKINDAQWHHIACVRSGSNCAMFYDGTRVATSTSSASLVSSASALHIGRLASGSTNDFYGYVSDVRIINGTAAYNPILTTITVPTSPLTAIANTQLLTLQYDQPHNNHTFLDSSSNQFLITRSGNATQGAFSPFSQTGWSNYFGGSSSALRTAATTAGDFSNNPFTIECWIYITALDNANAIFSNQDNGSNTTLNGYVLYIHTNGQLYFNDFSNASTPVNMTTSAGVVALNAWYHIVLEKRGTSTNQFQLFVNGTVVASATSNANLPVNTSNNPFTIGNWRYANDTNRGFWGYISNFRIVKSAVYNGTVTVPANPLTAIANTTLLTCQSNRFRDSSTNNLTFTVNGTISVQAFSPFAPTAVYNPVSHGGSAYFDGTGDYIALPTSNATLYPGSGAFTFECWIYPTGTLATLQSVFSYGGSAGNLRVFIQNGGLQLWNGATSFTAGNTALVKNNSWNHIVVQRDSSNYLTSYVNGTRDYYTVQTVDYNAGSLQIAADGGANLLTGYESGFSFIKGSATYSGATITVPIAPLTATTNTQLLLNFTDAAILDSTGRTVLETAADTKSSSVITKFTGGSMSFDGTGDYLQSSAPLSELAFLHNGTPWTIEGWFYTGSTSLQTILSTDAASATIGMSIDINNTTTRDLVCVIYRGVSGSYHVTVSSGSVWSLSTWTYFAVVLDASKNLTVYINGSQVATTSASSFSFSSSNPTYPLVIGRYQFSTPGGYFNGYISDLRITRGYARYTTNFTAPTAPARLK